jgi:hypothetical protein
MVPQPTGGVDPGHSLSIPTVVAVGDILWDNILTGSAPTRRTTVTMH